MLYKYIYISGSSGLCILPLRLIEYQGVLCFNTWPSFKNYKVLFCCLIFKGLYVIPRAQVSIFTFKIYLLHIETNI